MIKKKVAAGYNTGQKQELSKILSSNDMDESSTLKFLLEAQAKNMPNGDSLNSPQNQQIARKIKKMKRVVKMKRNAAATQGSQEVIKSS